MKKTKINILHSLRFSLLLSVLVYGAMGCEDPVNFWSTDSEEMVLSEYIAAYDDYSEFAEMLDEAGLNSLLSISLETGMTVFVPTNEAIDQFYADNGYSSYLDMDTDELKNFLYTHMIPSQISVSQIGLGSLPDTNVVGDYIVSDFLNASESEYDVDTVDSYVRLNKTALIIDEDVEVANGYIHVIDKTIPLITKSVYETLSEMSGYDIFTEALEMTGLQDTLNDIYFDYGGLAGRNRYTILAVDDNTFAEHGITSVSQLVDYLGGDINNSSDPNDALYKYIEYHCLSGTYYLSDLSTNSYFIISKDNVISMTITDDYKINPDDSDRSIYTGFKIEESNYPAKNGAIHTIDDLLEEEQSGAVYYEWELTDQLDVINRDFYGLDFYKFSQDEPLVNVKWSGDYLLYYLNPPNKLSNSFSMLGYWWIEVTTPKIMKGKYDVSATCKSPSCILYVDGVKQGVFQGGGDTEMGTFEWTETETHTFKLVTIDYGTLFWKSLIFDPVK